MWCDDHEGPAGKPRQLDGIELLHVYSLEPGGADVQLSLAADVAAVKGHVPQTAEHLLNVAQSGPALSKHVLHEKQLAALCTSTKYTVTKRGDKRPWPLVPVSGR